jgi:general secretion pathway protein E/type IV pilus assembly protein PilB
VVLVTGPTGSGKTSTLASLIDLINANYRKHIITLEDPIEYLHPSKKSVVHQRGLHYDLTDFPSGLRAALREDPDIILIGEMRDLETAEAAIQSSLTGHLVFSTLHTNDAPSSFTRLIDMDVEPFLVASTVEGVMAQRLVRTICPECKHEYQPHHPDVPPDFPGFDVKKSAVPTVWKGAGCRSCRNTGYRGRTGIHELLVNNDRLKDMIVQRVNAGVIRADAIANGGMRTLRQDGWKKVQLGITTIDEVARTTAGDVVTVLEQTVTGGLEA